MKYVQSYLKDRGLPHSASRWDILFSTRIDPQLESGALNEGDLHDILRGTEEHGSQHIFLYRCSRTSAQQYCNSSYLERMLTSLGLDELLHTPKILYMPSEPTIIDVRLDADSSLVIKVAETRKRNVRTGDEERDDGGYAVVYHVKEERACNVARLRPDGLLELKVASRSTSDRYQKLLEKFSDIINTIIPLSGFTELSLARVKEKVSKKDDSLDGVLRLSRTQMRNSQGNSLQVATGDVAKNLSSDGGVNAGLRSFNEASRNVSCEQVNFWLITRDGEDFPTKPINIAIGGEVNEFTVGAKCTKDDYEYALGKIIELNSPVSN